MKDLRLSLLLMGTTLCGVALFLSLRPLPAPRDARSLSALIEPERMLLERQDTQTTTTVKRGRDGRLLYFYDGEWRTTPPPAQDLPVRVVRPVERTAFPGGAMRPGTR